MPDWFQQAFTSDAHLAAPVVLTRLLAAAALSCVVSLIYRFTHGRAANSTLALMSTLVLLSVTVAMMTIVIGDNTARAFALAGTLAIVRFRTIVEDTRDTAFVVLAVGVGMAVGAGYITIPLLILPIAALVAFAFRPRPEMPATPAAAIPDAPLDCELAITLGAGHASDETMRAALAPHALSTEFRSVATARQGAAIETTYAIRLKSDAQAQPLIAALNRLEGFQSVELRRL